MISNYNLSCDYHNFELKDKIYLIPDWALKVIYTDGFNEVVFSGNSANVTILEGYDISFQEETSFDERFKFSKSVSIKVNGYKTFNDLDYRYCVVLETKEGEFYLVNSDFPSFVTHTYTLNNGTNSTELVFSSQSNIATLKLTNFEPINVNKCKEYSIPKIKNVKLTEAWASYLSTWQKSLVNKGEFVDIEPLPDSVSLTEEFDGEKYTVTLGFDIPMSYYKNDWHIKLLQFEENKYRGYISLEDGNKAFVGYNVGLFPSYAINGDIISIRLTETAIRGIAYGDDYAIIDTNMPNSIEFLGATCKNYNFESSCDWEVESKPNYITITPMSGNADTQYTLQVCNTDTEAGYAVSEFIIKSCNARVRPEVVIKNPIYRYTATTETVCSEATERTISSETYCSGSHNVDKYVDVTKEVSYDSGETWYFASSSSTLVEANSPDCGYRTRTVSTGTTCSGTHNVDKYKLIEFQKSYDYGNTWVTVSSSRGSLIEANSPDCGYRTQTVSTGYTCDGVDKYQLIENQESYDYGNTWVTVSSTTGSLIAEYSPDCGFDPTPEPLSGQYFTIEALEDASKIVFEMSTTIFTDIDFRYSIDSGTTWTTMPYVHNNNKHFYSCGSEFDSGTKVMFKANFWDDISVYPYNVSLGTWKVTKTSGGKAKYNVEGNVLSLYFHDFINDGVDFYYPNLWQLFATEYVVNARKLSLPCTRLTEERCYFGMFYSCEHLVTAPALPATSLSDGCYHQMFKGCIRLTSAPALPATTLSSVEYGYGCYSEMFAECSSLEVAPQLPASKVHYKSYAYMFRNCTSLTTAPVLSAKTLYNRCYYGMFSGCTSLSSITCLATDISATYCTYMWVNNVSASGTFYKNSSMSNWPTGNNGIPSGWTVQNYSS